MFYNSVAVPLIIVAYLVAASLAMTAAMKTRRTEPDLTFAESVYARLSGACEWLSLTSIIYMIVLN